MMNVNPVILELNLHVLDVITVGVVIGRMYKLFVNTNTEPQIILSLDVVTLSK